KGHHYFKMTRSVLELEHFKRTLDDLVHSLEARRNAPGAQGRLARVAELRDYRDRLLLQMQTRYRRLHRDFRGHADEAVAAFRASLDDLLARFAAGIPAQ
ncbi:MAG: hypothetical protein KGI56_01535, partial [Acidobacteriota bacterium]|nr:hypothetical protein [Acidobacteriota bacterium]